MFSPFAGISLDLNTSPWMLKHQPVQNAMEQSFLIPFPPICVLILNPRSYEDTQENLGLQENVFIFPKGSQLLSGKLTIPTASLYQDSVNFSDKDILEREEMLPKATQAQYQRCRK